MFFLAFVIGSFYALLTTAVPSPNPYVVKPLASIEQWVVPRLDMHMMTRFTGIPGNSPWPESARFPTSIDFDINMPNKHNAHCHNEWMNGTLPDNLAACTSESGRIGFRMEEYTALGRRRKELSFTLQVFRLDNVSGQQTVLIGEVAITANDPKEPTSYLTCLQGAPFDGLRCKIGGPMSVRKGLALQVHTSNNTTTSPLVAAS